MKKIIAFILILLFVFTLCACDIDSGEYETDGKPIIVLPDTETAETINGYNVKMLLQHRMTTAAIINLKSQCL